MSDLPVRRRLLQYSDSLAERAVSSIDLLVIHCTELPDLAMAREYGERVHYPGSGTGNSGHYYIDRDGDIEQWVPLERIAHHVRGFNEHSIGIELVNIGRYPNWLDSRHQAMHEAYEFAQLNSLAALVTKLSKKLPSLRWVAGHEELDTEKVAASDNPELEVFRKRDPGALFPWQEFLATIPLERYRTRAGTHPTS